MKLPICSVCGESNYPAQAWMHKDCTATNELATKPEQTVVANADTVVANSKHGKYSDTEKRKSYQREIMRKRRAKEKT